MKRLLVTRLETSHLRIKVDEPYFAFNSYSNQSIIEISSFEPSEFRKSNRNLYFMEQSL